MSPAAALSILIYTPAAVGAVGFVPDPAHAMGPRVIPLVVIVELFDVREAEVCPFTCSLQIVVCCIVNNSPFVDVKHCFKI